MVSLIAPAVLSVVVAWWLATGVILYLDGLPRRTFARSMLGVSLLLGCALYGVTVLRDTATIAGAYGGFGCGLMVWAWLEMGFLMGFITGPRRRGCDLSCRGWRHFAHASQAILYHELSIVAAMGAVALLSWGSANRVALETLAALWSLRLSTKLNLFLGVRNLGEELLPPHLVYLRSFFRKQSMNFLFPVSVTAAGVVTTLLALKAAEPRADEFHCVTWTLLATLFGLGILEHWALVLPFSSQALWSWGFRSRKAALGI